MITPAITATLVTIFLTVCPRVSANGRVFPDFLRFIVVVALGSPTASQACLGLHPTVRRQSAIVDPARNGGRQVREGPRGDQRLHRRTRRAAHRELTERPRLNAPGRCDAPLRTGAGSSRPHPIPVPATCCVAPRPPSYSRRSRRACLRALHRPRPAPGSDPNHAA